MSLWGWIRKVVADQTGGLEPIEVELERNPGAVVELGAENPPGVPLYVLRVGLRGGFGQTRAGLAVHRRENPASHPVLKEIYHCEVAGKTLEAANVFALRAKVQRQLEAIAPARRLPLCYFRAPRLDHSLPVYAEGARLVCPVLAGPKIKAAGLAEIREPVLRHLRTAGYLGPDEEPQVLVLRPSDLGLVAPAAILRSLDDPSFWLPTVEGTAPEGPVVRDVVGLLFHPTELLPQRRPRLAPATADVPPSAPDVTALLRLLGIELAERGRIAEPWGLYACEVRPEIWARTEELTEPTELRLYAHLEGSEQIEMHVRRTAAGELVAALRDPAISVFLAGEEGALARVAGRYLVAAGFLRDAADVRVQAAPAPPAESLDPEAIWPRPGRRGEPRGGGPAEPSAQPTTTHNQEVAQT